MAGTKTDVRFMTNLVNAAAKQRRWVMASQLVQLMRSYGVPPNEVTYTCILSQMSKAKQVSRGKNTRRVVEVPTWIPPLVLLAPWMDTKPTKECCSICGGDGAKSLNPDGLFTAHVETFLSRRT